MSKRKLSKRQVTERSESVVSHVDAISGYNARLSTLIESEKSKDDMMRTLEKQLHADKLKHADLIADVSFGHELMEIEETRDKEYDVAEAAHADVGAKLREAIAEYEEVSARLALADVEAGQLKSELSAATQREEALQGHFDTMSSKLETLKANEKAAMQTAAASVKKSEDVRVKHEKAFDKRPSTQSTRKNSKEIESLVQEVQNLRAEHAKLMKKLHANEMKEIKVLENQISGKLGEEDAKLKAQFSKEELKALEKHDRYQKELQEEMKRLEENLKSEVEAKESALRTKIKKLTQAKSKLNTAVENLRQENVDLSSERDSSEMQLKHLNGVSGDRGKSLEAAKSEELKLKAELAAIAAQTKASNDGRKKVAHKYALVVNQNKKMAAEIAKYSSLVIRGENELEFSPANKRIRLHQDKLA